MRARNGRIVGGADGINVNAEIERNEGWSPAPPGDPGALAMDFDQASRMIRLRVRGALEARAMRVWLPVDQLFSVLGALLQADASARLVMRRPLTVAGADSLKREDGNAASTDAPERPANDGDAPPDERGGAGGTPRPDGSGGD